MKRAYYSDSIANFLTSSKDEILGRLTRESEFAVLQTQRMAWLQQIAILQEILAAYEGAVYFEYAIPRMGRRIDAVLIISQAIFVLEFKVGDSEFSAYATDQVWDYALDLKNFHETSHDKYIAPILIATEASNSLSAASFTPQTGRLFQPIKTNSSLLGAVLESVLTLVDGACIDPLQWETGRYYPTPTIIEAAIALYNDHTVADISRSDASAINLGQTSEAISDIIRRSREQSLKSICFVTGVPGAGKTLVGLNIATKHNNSEDELYSVYLSGNGPLVDILREALARDKVRRSREKNEPIRKGDVIGAVKKTIQNIHHFRDACIVDQNPPAEHVALFDEAQRAWDVEQTSSFMNRKKGIPGFNQSEPEFLISCLNRHSDWAVIVCLVGGGQEINTGEAGISEWIDSLNRKFPDWHVHISPWLNDSEYGEGNLLQSLANRQNVYHEVNLHLAISMRSFRAENVSLLVKQLLDQELDAVRKTFNTVKENYPIVITRDLLKAKQWLRKQAQGTERYGIIVSSQAERLKPHAINVKCPINPIHWFLDEKDDVRSSYFLEDVATEFHVQGLELDWACITWDADFRYSPNGWEHWSFKGNRWEHINRAERQIYQKNAYRVLLTRARQGMVIVVPQGNAEDQTRNPRYYDATYNYLKDIGFPVI